MSLLGPLGLGLVVAGLGVFCSIFLCDIFLCGVERKTGEIGGVGTHVGDESALVESLRNAHRGAHRQMELA